MSQPAVKEDGGQSIHEFILKLENSAKRVLKEANKKQREAMLAEQAKAIVAGRREVAAKSKKKGKGFAKTGSLMMKSSALTSSMDANDSTLLGTAPPGTQTLELRYSVPRMFVSMAADTIDANAVVSEIDQALMTRSSTASGNFSGNLSPIKKKSTTVGARALTERPMKRNVTLERLGESAYISGKTGSIDEIMLSKKTELAKLRESRANPGETNAAEQTTSVLKSQVSEVMSGKRNGATKLHRKLLKQRKAKLSGSTEGRKAETQGPVDWSINGLKCKYRGEMERESAWRSWASANEHSEKALDEHEVVIPIAKIERHPLYVQFYGHTKSENTASLVRTKNRLRMKRFVFDVHEVWLTNLQHLREHQPARILAEKIPNEKESAEDRGAGLENRRDFRAIESMSAQVQSVSQKRSLDKAYFTTKPAEPKVVLNFEPADTALLKPARILPPSMEVLVDGFPLDEINVDSTSSSSTKNDVVLFVDRLLPASDQKSARGDGDVHDKVLWRLSLYRKQDIALRHYIILESEVESLVKKIVEESSQKTKLVKVYESDEDLLVPWSVMDIYSAIEISVGYKQEGVPSSGIKIKIEAHLKADYDGQTLEILCSPIELRHILNIGSLSLDNLEWWSNVARYEDTWKALLSLLYIVDGDTNEFGDPEPVSIALSCERTAADRVPGALTTSQSLSSAQELVGAIQVDNHLNLSIGSEINGESSLFLNPRHPEIPAEREDKEINLEIVVDHQFDPDSNIGPLVDEKPKGYDVFGDLDALNTDLREGKWEEVVDNRCSTLSMATSGALASVAQVPGSIEIGKMGLWFEHRMFREYTQAAAIFFRDGRLSTTDMVFVNVTMALDTTIIFSTTLAWEDFSQQPPMCVAEEVRPYIPPKVARPGTILVEELISPIDERMSQVAALFGKIPDEGLDHVPLDAPSKPLGMMRHWEPLNQYGFRQRLVETLLGVDPVLPTVVFGITKFGATANIAGVNSRNIWHSTLSITEHINRPRSSKDYHYIVSNEETQGANDPATFAARMKSGECVGLSSSAFRTFEKEYEEIKARREMFARQLALDAKIESSEIALRTREKSKKAEMQKELQRAIEKKMRKSTKSEKGWSRRFHASTTLEVQGTWERRKDEKTHCVFFRKIPDGVSGGKGGQKEKFAETCQWEVPATWDGDPLSVPYDEYGPDEVMGYGDDASAADSKSGVGSSITGAFEQPADNWHPGADTSAYQGKTAGNEAKVAVPTRIAKDAFSVTTSLAAEESMGESGANTIDTANLEHIAEQLVSSDELMKILARRLGLSEQNVVPAEEMSAFSVSVDSTIQMPTPKTGNVMGDDAMNAPRDNYADDAHEIEFDSDDDLWSDDEQEAGDYDEDLVGDLPQSHFDANKLRRDKMFANQPKDVETPENVPFLNLKGAGVITERDDEEVGAGWRKLARPDIPEKFFEKCLITQTLGPDQGSSNTFNTPVFLVPISPVDACQYVPENFTSNVESIFVPDAKKDMERAVATVDRNIKREEQLSKNVATDDLLLFGAASESTTADKMVAKQFKEDKNAFIDPKEGATRKALLAAKSNNIAEMEDALEEAIPINSADEFGNTLLILAAQQGSKRMCKFLLRRGANINSQSLTGNTALHYCYAYGQHDLGVYLKQKGADDSILNQSGLTCYEGLDISAIQDDDDEDDEDGEVSMEKYV